MLRKTLAVAALAIGGLWASTGTAQDIVIPNIIELSGRGATVGAMWKNGSSLAVEEINNSGGILGKKIKLEFVDTASDPGKARAAMQRALDDKPIAIFGPGILIEATWDDTGEIDRISFLGEVRGGKQVITEVLPKLKK